MLESVFTLAALSAAHMTMLAYVDPGLGLLAWQAIVASALGCVFYVKKTRSMVFRLFRRAAKSDPGSIPRGPACSPDSHNLGR